MTKLNKLFKWSLPVLAVTSTVVFAISCGSTGITEKLLTTLKTDSKAVALKTSLSGYSKEEMEIVVDKKEITEESKAMIDAFNQFYETKLKFSALEGTQSIDEKLVTKFTSGVGNVLLVSAAEIVGFESIHQHLVDTAASKMLVGDNTSEGEFTIKDKHFMPATIDTIGVIYNKDTFAKANITVYEGKTFEEASTKPANLVKPTDDVYNGAVIYADNLYVFTDDLTEEGYKAIVTKLKTKSIKPVYTTSKAGKTEIKPISNHLLGAVVNAETGLTSKDTEKLTTAEDMMNANVVAAMKKALEIYGHNNEENATDHTIAKAMESIANGTFAMSQNGSWSMSEIQKVNNKAKVGFLPLPVFNKTDKTAMIYKSASQRWATTTLTNDEAKLKTAKLFLQFMYQTKTGIESASNNLQITSPFKALEGVKPSSTDQLATSALEYTGKDLGETVDNYFVKGFNNDSVSLVTVANEGFANGLSHVEKLKREIQRLKDKPTE